MAQQVNVDSEKLHMHPKSTSCGAHLCPFSGCNEADKAFFTTPSKEIKDGNV